METSTHHVAMFEEGFMLVDVNPEDIEDYGEEEMWQAIQKHPFVASKGKPVVIVYEDEDEEQHYYGDSKLVDALAKMDPDAINWGQELTLEWPDEPSNRTVTTTHSVATFKEGFMLVDVHPDDIKEYGEEEMWQAIQKHPFVVSKGIPVVIVYEDKKEDQHYYGDSKLVDALAKMDPDDIVWDEELTLEWPAED